MMKSKVFSFYPQSLAIVALVVLLGAGLGSPFSSVRQVPSGTWALTGTMAEARTGAASVLLPDGRVLITGGLGERGLLASAEFYNSDGTFSPAAPMHFARSRHTAVVFEDGRVLVAGGETVGEGPTNSAEIYDLASDSWTIVGAMAEARAGHSASVLPNGQVLVAGGWSARGVRASLEVFDPATESFRYAGALSSPRRDHTASALADGRVLFAGGSDGSAVLASAEIYDLNSQSLFPAGNLSGPRASHSATLLLNGNVLVAGGYNSGEELRSAEMYDPARNEWSATGNLVGPRRDHLVFLLPHNNSVLIIGGTYAGLAVRSAELFLPWEGRFTRTGSLGAARVGASGSALAQEGLLMVAGGRGQRSVESFGFATVRTDRGDYVPGDVVGITGSGWQPGEGVNLIFHEVPGLHADHEIETKADASGNFLSNQFSLRRHEDSVTVFVTARGVISQAKTSFADRSAKPPPEPTTTVLASDNNPSLVGESVTFAATVDSAKGKPTGTVTFFDGAAQLGTGTLNQQKIATFSTSDLTAGTHSITAQYSGDNKFAGSTSNVVDQIVNEPGTISTSTLLETSKNPSQAGETVTFTATVSGDPGAGVPTGTVTFFDGTTQLGTGTLTEQGFTTLNTSDLTAGDHSITAEYSGDANFAGSTSDVLIQTVNQAATSTLLQSEPNPSQAGETVTFTATVSVSLAASALTTEAVQPTGTVTFFDGTAQLGTGTLTEQGFTTLNVSDLTVGDHSITAEYSGDGNFAGSTSNVLIQTVEEVTGAPTSTLLQSEPNPSQAGETVTFTATVSSESGKGKKPTGAVTFFDGTTQLGTGTLNRQGFVTFNTSDLAAGDHSITAVYSGDANFAGSTSNVVIQTVNPAATSTLLQSEPNPSQAGETVTFTATVSVSLAASALTTEAVQPTGTVTFFDGTAQLGTGSLNSQGFTTLNVSDLTVGDHSVTAVYSGDGNFAGSTSNVLIQTVEEVTGAPTSTLLQSEPNPSQAGETVTFTATVSVSLAASALTPEAVQPTGTVTFFDGAAQLGTGSLNSQGFTTLNVSDLTVGDHSITAVYSGDANFAGSTSNVLTQTVNQAATSTLLQSIPNPSQAGETVTFTATVSVSLTASALTPEAVQPTGTVTFLDNGVVLPGASDLPLNSGGWVTFNTSDLAAGTHPITAVYSGDANFAGSTSNVLTQTVNQAATSTLLQSIPNPSQAGETVTFTATVSVSLAASALTTEAVQPTGTVTFLDNGVVLPGASDLPLNSGGWLTFNTSDLAAGTHPITAVYSGDANFAGSTSNVLNQEVN